MVAMVVLMCVLYSLTRRKVHLERQAEIDHREGIRQRLKEDKIEADRYFN